MKTLARVRPRDHDIAAGLPFHELGPGRVTDPRHGAMAGYFCRQPRPRHPGVLAPR